MWQAGGRDRFFTGFWLGGLKVDLGVGGRITLS
jgi:hypothetical protein